MVWEPADPTGFLVFECGRVIIGGESCVRSNSDGLMVVSASTNDELYKISADNNDLVIVSSAGKYLAVSSPTEGVALFDSVRRIQIARLRSTWGFDQVHFSVNEKVLAANDPIHFAVYDIDRRKEISAHVTDVHAFAISRLGDLLWTASGFASPQVLTIAAKNISSHFPDQFSSDYESSVFGEFMDRDSKVVMRTSLGKVGVWDWRANKLVEIPTKAKDIAVAESLILTVTEQGVAELWDRDARKMFTFDAPVKRAVITPDGDHVITLSEVGSLIMWDIGMVSSSRGGGDLR